MNGRVNGWTGVDAVLDELEEGDVVFGVEDVSVAFGEGFEGADQTKFPIALSTQSLFEACGADLEISIVRTTAIEPQ